MQTAFEISHKIQSLKLGTVFFDYSGHVNILTIRVHTPEWVANSDPSFIVNINGDKGYSSSNKKNILALNEFLLNQSIPTDLEDSLDLPF